MKQYKLKEIMQFKYGKAQFKIENNDGPNNIYGSAGIIGKTNAFLYDKPSVLIGRKGTINNPMYAERPFWCIDTMFYSQINEILVIPKYLYYNFKTIDFNRFNESTGVPSLRNTTLENIQVSLPSIETQLRITNIISIN